MTKQHQQPCGTCPFTRNFEPNLAPGGSELKVYVAQHFMPFKVPCHECVNYEDDKGDPEHGWKEGALHRAECVGFAQCRHGDGVNAFMPDGLLRSAYNPHGDAFRDIWDFYAHHKQITRMEALIDARPDVIMGWCHEELHRPGSIDIKGDISKREATKRQMLMQTMVIVGKTWIEAWEGILAAYKRSWVSSDGGNMDIVYNNIRLNRWMEIAQDIKKELLYCKDTAQWNWADRDEVDNPDAWHGPFETFIDALKDAVEPYLEEDEDEPADTSG